MATSNISPLAKAYYEHYMGLQRGGAFPVFRGAPYQYGNGLSEVLRDAGKFLVPLASTAAQKFLESAASELAENKDAKLSSAAKKALKPTLEATAGKIAEQILGAKNSQKGSGKRRRRRARKSLYKGPSKKRRKTRNLIHPGFNF